LEKGVQELDVGALLEQERCTLMELERLRASRVRLEAAAKTKAAAEEAAAAKAAAEATEAGAAVTAGNNVAANSVQQVLEAQLQRIRGVLAAVRADNQHTSEVEATLLAALQASHETALTQLATCQEQDFEAHATAVRAAVEVVLRQQAASYRLKQKETLQKVLTEQHTRVMDCIRTSLQANNAHWIAVCADLETKLKAQLPE
jgi:hypothetical protein